MLRLFEVFVYLFDRYREFLSLISFSANELFRCMQLIRMKMSINHCLPLETFYLLQL
jgi:hypothetical protein